MNSKSYPVDQSELERYLRIYQENPDSRVFAPLADMYRRMGRLDEAELICREGIERHPYYAGGRVALSHILLDSGRFELSMAEADHVVTYYPDNLLARKLLIRALGGMGQVERAKRELEALKVLAPETSSDPDIERALQGPRKNNSFLDSPIRIQKNQGDGPRAAYSKIHKLIRKKAILEALIRRF
jgi:tetratricopeptide (TPR) repeat protein